MFLPDTAAFCITMLIVIMLVVLSDTSVTAAELTPDMTLSDGGSAGALQDGSHSTAHTFSAGSSVTIKSNDGAPISGVYIIWDSPVAAYTITTDSGEVSCGQYEFLHDYVKFDTPTASLTINMPSDTARRISDIRIFSEGELPSDVQVWNPPVTNADIMLVPSHADDEILFFGGIIPTYTYTYDAEIQVVYMTEFWSTTKIREHEKLDGLWCAGLKNYPVTADFTDLYSKDLATAESQYDFNEMVGFLTEQIRRFKPQVIVTHDEKGEYGHGYHMLTFKAVTTAVEAATDASNNPDSAERYGTWNTPKTYIHLYRQNAIHLDLRTPIPEMGGKTALEIASEAYKQHVSQQWCWFYVSDDYEYSCADFGLYRTTVGVDTSNNLLENLKTYKAQTEELESIIAAEQESIEQAAIEQESKMQALKSDLADLNSRQEELSAKLSKNNTFLITGIVLAIFLVCFFTIRIRRNSPSKRNK